MIVLRSLTFYLLFYIGTVFIALFCVAVAPFSRKALVSGAIGWTKWHHFLLRVVAGIRVQISGEIPDAKEILVASKHESMFEALDIARIFHQPVIYAKKELLGIPVWGWLASRYGILAVDRRAGPKALRAMLSDMKRGVACGRPVAIFPEGTRVAPGDCPKLRSGFAALYGALERPVVPVAVRSAHVYPTHGWLLRPGTIEYRIGDLIAAGLDRKSIEAKVHEDINALNDCSCRTN